MSSITNSTHSSKAKPITAEQQDYLLNLARQSIEASMAGFEATVERLITHESISKTLSFDAATFVTLKKNHQLRGCIGSLEAHQSLPRDVVKNARAAALYDSRFPPVNDSELGEIDIEISVLSPPERIDFDSTQALFELLQPNLDGVIIKYGTHSATFLPQVWSKLPEKSQFFAHLKRKAGLSDDIETTELEVFRYRVDHFAESKR